MERAIIPPPVSSGARAGDKPRHCPPLHTVVSQWQRLAARVPWMSFLFLPSWHPHPHCQVSEPLRPLGAWPPYEATCPHTCAHPRLDPPFAPLLSSPQDSPSPHLPAHRGSEHTAPRLWVSTAGHVYQSRPGTTDTSPVPGPAVRTHGLVGSRPDTQKPPVMVSTIMGTAWRTLDPVLQSGVASWRR